MEVRAVGRVVWEVAPLNEDYWNEFPPVVVENVWLQRLAVTWSVLGNNKVSGQLENFFRWNPSGTFRNIPWYH